MIDINMEVLEQVSEGETNAELMSKCIDAVAQQFPEESLDALKTRICDLWANQLAGFYEDDGEMTLDEHWNNNYEWGMDILESYMEDVT